MTLRTEEWIIAAARQHDPSAVPTLVSIAEEGVGVEAKVALDVLAYLGHDAASAAVRLAAVGSRALEERRDSTRPPRYA